MVFFNKGPFASSNEHLLLFKHADGHPFNGQYEYDALAYVYCLSRSYSMTRHGHVFNRRLLTHIVKVACLHCPRFSTARRGLFTTPLVPFPLTSSLAPG